MGFNGDSVGKINLRSAEVQRLRFEMQEHIWDKTRGLTYTAGYKSKKKEYFIYNYEMDNGPD